MESFADYILEEKEFSKKIDIMYYLKKKRDVYFDNSVVLKATIARMFMEVMDIDVDQNMVITAALLYSCKKVDNAQSFEKIKTYAKDGADYLLTLGFSKRFCKICEEHNRYSGSSPREKESDILELADQLGGMLMDRPERRGFPTAEAIVLLEYRNLKGINNIYLEQFKKFVDAVKEVRV